MTLDRTDKLVAVFTALVVVSTLGMLFDLWQLVYYPIPLFAGLFMVMGSLDARDRWSSRTLGPVLGLGAVLTLLFVVAGVTVDSETLVGGLPVSTATFMYAIWPVSVIGAPLAYAFVYRHWLADEVHEAAVAAEETRG